MKIFNRLDLAQDSDDTDNKTQVLTGRHTALGSLRKCYRAKGPVVWSV